MTSSDSSANPLGDYLAGQITAEQLVVSVSAEYYRETRNGKRETLRPIMDVVERAHPGVVELTAIQGPPGFAVRLAERPFPTQYEAELRKAVETVQMSAFRVSRFPVAEDVARRPGLVRRMLAAIRRLFSA